MSIFCGKNNETTKTNDFYFITYSILDEKNQDIKF